MAQLLLSEVRQQNQDARARCVVNDSHDLTMVPRRCRCLLYAVPTCVDEHYLKLLSSSVTTLISERHSSQACYYRGSNAFTVDHLKIKTIAAIDHSI